MNTTRIATIATLMLSGLTVAEANEVLPAWSAETFVMEEIVVTAEAPASYYMEEIVVTAQAPNHLFMDEIVVTATPPQSEIEAEAMGTVAAVQVPNPVMEEIVVTARPSDLRTRIAARMRNVRNEVLF
ncbi:MAG: hypothetical protein ACR2QQ_12690 [Gammaproteobacteria bacterium]